MSDRLKPPTSPEVELAYTELLAYAAGPNADRERKDAVRWRLDRLVMAQHFASTAAENERCSQHGGTA